MRKLVHVKVLHKKEEREYSILYRSFVFIRSLKSVSISYKTFERE